MGRIGVQPYLYFNGHKEGKNKRQGFSSKQVSQMYIRLSRGILQALLLFMDEWPSRIDHDRPRSTTPRPLPSVVLGKRGQWTTIGKLNKIWRHGREINQHDKTSEYIPPRGGFNHRCSASAHLNDLCPCYLLKYSPYSLFVS